MDRLPIHPYDLLMLVVLVAVTIYGFVKGMAWQLASLASIALSVFMAVRFSPSLAPVFSKEEPWNRFLAMLTLYLITSAAVWLVFRPVSRAIDRVKLKEFDRQAGALFGVAKGVLLCIVITFFAVTLSQPARDAVLASRSGYYIAVIIRNATPVLPHEVRDVLGKYIDQLNQNLPDPSKAAPPLPGRPAAPEAPAAPAPKAPGQPAAKPSARTVLGPLLPARADSKPVVPIPVKP